MCAVAFGVAFSRNSYSKTSHDILSEVCKPLFCAADASVQPPTSVRGRKFTPRIPAACTLCGMSEKIRPGSRADPSRLKNKCWSLVSPDCAGNSDISHIFRSGAAATATAVANLMSTPSFQDSPRIVQSVPHSGWAKVCGIPPGLVREAQLMLAFFRGWRVGVSTEKPSPQQLKPS